jgi:2'-5' RNA ligase
VSGDAIRAFFAAELSPGAREQAAKAIESLRALLGDEARWVQPEKLHLTLKFLGDFDADQVPKLAQRVAGKLVGESPFDVELGGLGAFPSARAARVVWLGVGAGVAPLARLARKTDAAAARLGVPRERRPYRGHLTLGRLRRPGRVPLEHIVPPDPVSFPVNEVVLFESRLSSAGSTYIPLVRLPLGTDAATELDFAPEI